jgi:hypothetical protein
MILSEIIRTLGLTLYSTGHVHESPSEIRSWVDIEVLPSAENLLANKRRFYGETAHTTDRALENACQSAITHLMTKCRVQVDDANFNELEIQKKSLQAATSFENLFKEGKDVQLKYMDSLRESNEIILDRVHQICVASAGFLPIKILPLMSNQTGRTKVEYNGPIQATEPKDELAAALVDLASTKLIVGLLKENVSMHITYLSCLLSDD